MEYAFRITIENFRSKPVDVEVLDQLPVSRNSKIEIITKGRKRSSSLALDIGFRREKAGAHFFYH
jgi:hypothetical protein